MLPAMFGMGGTEILVILIVALLFLGPDKLPQAAKQISKGIRDLKQQTRSLQNQIESDEQIGGALRDIKSALRGEDEPVRPKPIKKPKKPKELPAPEVASGEPEPVIAPPAEPAKVEAKAPVDDGWEAEAEPVAPAPAPKMSPTAGEPDEAVPPTTASDDEELASMIRPAAGTVAKGSEPKHG